ncbi:MAG: cobalamin biosynthesis protein CobD [Thaumarchaeota archaeon 13_1_40CM_3_38_6]|nr:MAG: cobalamin biosynthesis protein CobD [Thaumarchaeota archaeon 13_1_40CM_3_38_6]
MIVIPIFAVILALAIDFAFGDPKNKYHPTVWIGKLVSKVVSLARSNNPISEKLGGTIVVMCVLVIVCILIMSLVFGLKYLNNLEVNGFSKILILASTIVVTGILLKTTIAIKGMEQHASKIMEALSKNDLDDARTKLSMIVKRNTKNLDRQHIISATLESISENIVDGVTGPLFYFAIFGLTGAFIHRAVNTIDSMIGYKTDLFRNIGWFGANCDKVLNYLPSRITSLVMILASIILKENWRHSLEVMRRDGPKTESPNAGYPMATMAGALGIRFEKLDHYILGDGISDITETHFKLAVSIMKLTSILFVALFTIPVIAVLSYLGWWSFV